MRLPLVLNPEAEADLIEAKAWYDGQRPGLGDSFVRAVDGVLASIPRMPELHPRFFGELRLVLVGRFPYAVVYRIDDDQVTVVAVYHTSRDPRGWQGRA